MDRVGHYLKAEEYLEAAKRWINLDQVQEGALALRTAKIHALLASVPKEVADAVKVRYRLSGRDADSASPLSDLDPVSDPLIPPYMALAPGPVTEGVEKRYGVPPEDF